jgi:hypothetical protein
MKRNGIMEYWNIGMMGRKKGHVFPIIPAFHYSSIPDYFPHREDR